MTVTSTLSITEQQADLLRKMLPGAVKRTTDKLDKGLTFFTEGEDSNLDDFFGVGGNTTVDKTKFIAPIFNPSLAKEAKEQGLDYIKEEADRMVDFYRSCGSPSHIAPSSLAQLQR
jgi:hypothetical protein